ncbi:MAG: permease [Gammaproteobacteria bacterium]|nr:permease [Gammaproteobacteria bacterium]
MDLSAKKLCHAVFLRFGNNLFTRYILPHLFLLVIWWTLYSHLRDGSVFLVDSLLHIDLDSRLGSAVEFFLYDTPKVFMLLGLVVYGVGLLRSFITPERTRRFLAGKREFVGNIIAALLGIITPFCSCSAVPLFIGFVSAGVPLGVTFSFLIAAPMVNEIALVLLYGLLGWKLALAYLLTGLCVAIVAGLVIGRSRPEKYVEDWVKNIRFDAASEQKAKSSWHDRILFAYSSVVDIFRRIWLYVLIGIALGAFIHGYVPQGFMAFVMGSDSWWSVPLAVLLGVPLYSNAAGIIPVVEALISKGAAIGTVLAFMMSVIALSFPEMVILRKVLKPRLIGIFLVTVVVGVVMVGYLFNWMI